MPHFFSYRIKTPLAMTLVILISAATVSALLAWQGYREAGQRFEADAMGLGKVLARTVKPALLHDDVWLAYEILVTPLEHPDIDAKSFILLDKQDRIFAASNPRRFPVSADFKKIIGDDFTLTGNADGQTLTASKQGRFLYILTPVLAEDGAVLGRLVQRYDRAALGPRLARVATGTLYAALAALILLLPLGWLAGKRLAEPLSHLAECMGRVGRESPDAIQCEFPEGHDEINVLALRFRQMLEELKSKQALEQHLAQSDRLAAIGRLSAGIAHEINNPLGGMLNAISNYRRAGGADPRAEKTLSLIERGLMHIRDTVSALLVEARLESRALAPADVEDVRTLVAADIQRKRIRLDWRNGLTEPIPLPSAQIRQILLNLLMNAVQAAPVDGMAACALAIQETSLIIQVSNDGPAIPPRRREHLFEPYFGEGEGHGLGLWVTYQLVEQLKGDITVESLAGHTSFTVNLPFAEHHES